MTIESSVRRLRINDTDVFLEDMGLNRGKITISNIYGKNYSYFWGSMGGTLEQFICGINGGYFADKLMGSKSNYVIDVKKTFVAIRKHIATEMGLPWYRHIEFQKDMREKLNEFQKLMEEYQSSERFVAGFFHHFIDRLSFFLIKSRYDMKEVEKDFKDLTECWHFIVERENDEYLWLVKFHGKLKKKLLNSEQSVQVSDTTKA